MSRLPRQQVLNMDWRIYLVIPQHVPTVVDIQASLSVFRHPQVFASQGRVVRAPGDRRAEAE